MPTPEAVIDFFHKFFTNTGNDLSGGGCGQAAYQHLRLSPEFKLRALGYEPGEITHVFVEYKGKYYDGRGEPFELRPGEILQEVELVDTRPGYKGFAIKGQTEAWVEARVDEVSLKAYDRYLEEGAGIKLPGTQQTREYDLPTTNELYRDAALRHQIDLRRYTAGLNKRIAALLEKADAELTQKLKDRLAKFDSRDLDYTGERWKALLADLKENRAAALAEFRGTVRGELDQLAPMEASREVSVLQSAVPIEIQFASVAAEQLRAIVSAQPFQGRLLSDWFKTLEQADQQRLVQAIQLGMVQGEPVEDIVRRVVGTRKNNYADGILSMTRRDAQGIVRTAVNHVSNTARGYVWDANSDIITAKVWVSTLDGRTTAVCRARDGHGSPVGDNELPADIPLLQPKDAKPPAHINCRSVMVAYIDGAALLGNRPTVTDTRNRRRREIDFRAEAKRTGKSIQEVRREWADANVGRVPSSTTYQDFLSRQPAAFQDEVLGKTKAKLFREGGLNVDQFVDRAGNELTLSQLAERKPDAFRKAGLDPEKF